MGLFSTKKQEFDVLGHLPEAVLVIQKSGAIEWANDNACKIFDLSNSKLTKQNLNDLLENGMHIASQAIDGSSSFVARTKNHAEKELFVEIRAKDVKDKLVLSIRDVTSSHRTVSNILVEHENSKKVSKDKNEFLVKLSNEIKSPIHSIIGFSQAMIDGLGGQMSEKQDKYVKIINKNSNELLYFMDKMVELSKSESSLFDYNFQTFDVINSVQSLLRANEQAIKDKNLNLAFDFEEVQKRAIYSDEEILKNVLQNILEVAIKSTDIGSISIKLSYPELEFVQQQGLETRADLTEKSYLMFTITDTGSGMNEEDLQNVFDPYCQLDKANKKNIAKSIALATSKNFLRYLKGTIWINSEIMQGSTYRVLIPIEKA